MILSSAGQRKYLTNKERELFLRYAEQFEPETLTLCSVMAATGCRVSEALAMTGANIDFSAKSIVIESLKKRKRGIYRSVPVHTSLLNLLRVVHGIDGSHAGALSARPLWPFCRMTAYRRIRKVMEAAGIDGAHAMPKGLRHGFGVTAIHSKAPLNLVQRWLGHADMRTTALYTCAIGPEERSIALRMWKHSAVGRVSTTMPDG